MSFSPDADPYAAPPSPEEKQVIEMLMQGLPHRFRRSFDDQGITVTNLQASQNYPVVNVHAPFRGVSGYIEQPPDKTPRLGALNITHGTQYLPLDNGQGYSEVVTTFDLGHQSGPGRDATLRISATHLKTTTLQSSDSSRVKKVETIDSHPVTANNIGYVLGIIKQEVLDPFES